MVGFLLVLNANLFFFLLIGIKLGTLLQVEDGLLSLGHHHPFLLLGSFRGSFRELSLRRGKRGKAVFNHQQFHLRLLEYLRIGVVILGGASRPEQSMLERYFPFGRFRRRTFSRFTHSSRLPENLERLQNFLETSPGRIIRLQVR